MSSVLSYGTAQPSSSLLTKIADLHELFCQIYQSIYHLPKLSIIKLPPVGGSVNNITFVSLDGINIGRQRQQLKFQMIRICSYYNSTPC